MRKRMCYNVNTVFNGDVSLVGNIVVINGRRMPPCPTNAEHVTVINKKVYIDGYELVNGKWRRTLKALWHLLF